MHYKCFLQFGDWQDEQQSAYYGQGLYNEGPYYYDEEDNGKGGIDIESIKEQAKKIVPLLILGFVVFLLLDVFFFSVKEVVLEIRNVEGKAVVANVEVKLIEEESGLLESLITEKIKRNYCYNCKFSLRRATYEISVSARGYKKAFDTIYADEFSENITREITLEKDIKSRFLDINAEFEVEYIFPGTEFFVNLHIENKGSKKENLEFYIFGKNVKKIDDKEYVVFGEEEGKRVIVKLPEVLEIEGKTVDALRISVLVEENLKVKSKGSKVEFSVGIKGLKKGKGKTKKVEFLVNKKPKISISKSKLQYRVNVSRLLNKGENKFSEKENIKISVNAPLELSVSASIEGSISKYVSFENGEKTTLINTQINDGKAEAIIEVLLEIDLRSISKEETLQGKIKINVGNLVTEEIPVTIEIENIPSVSLTYYFDPSETAQIYYDPDIAGFPVVNDYSLVLENDGDIKIENIIVKITNDFECSQEIIGFSEEIFDLEKGKTKRINFTISLPQIAITYAEPLECSINIRYRNPLTQQLINEHTKFYIEAIVD